MSIQSIEAKLKRLERQGERLRQQLEARKARDYTAIPGKYGFKSMEAFIAALTPYTSSRRSSHIKQPAAAKAKKTSAPTQANKKPKRGRPSRYTDQQKAAVKEALQKGGKTVAQIAKEQSISEFSIVDWKKRWGLVKSRKRQAKPAKKK